MSSLPYGRFSVKVLAGPAFIGVFIVVAIILGQNLILINIFEKISLIIYLSFYCSFLSHCQQVSRVSTAFFLPSDLNFSFNALLSLGAFRELLEVPKLRPSWCFHSMVRYHRATTFPSYHSSWLFVLAVVSDWLYDRLSRSYLLAGGTLTFSIGNFFLYPFFQCL